MVVSLPESISVDGSHLDVPRLTAFRRGDKRVVAIHLHGLVTYVELAGHLAASLARVLAPEEEPVPVQDDGGEDG